MHRDWLVLLPKFRRQFPVTPPRWLVRRHNSETSEPLLFSVPSRLASARSRRRPKTHRRSIKIMEKHLRVTISNDQRGIRRLWRMPGNKVQAAGWPLVRSTMGKVLCKTNSGCRVFLKKKKKEEEEEERKKKKRSKHYSLTEYNFLRHLSTPEYEWLRA